MRGRFISVEGGEGAGKSTQIALLSAALKASNIAHITTREPGGSDGAEAIRELIVTGNKDRFDPVSETLLIMAARAHHVQSTIFPALERGQWVLCDRFFDSTRVYQGIAKQLGDDWLQQLHHAIFGNLLPDVTLLYDLDPETGLKRALARKGKETRFEELPLAFHQALRSGFLAIAQREPHRVAVIDASTSIESIHAATLAALNQRLSLNLTAGT